MYIHNVVNVVQHRLRLFFEYVNEGFITGCRHFLYDYPQLYHQDAENVAAR